MLTQMNEVVRRSFFRERGRITLEMLSQLAEVTDVLLFGRRPIIFKLEVLLELGDRRIVKFHRPGSLPSGEDDFPANSSLMPATFQPPCRAAAQFNKR